MPLERTFEAIADTPSRATRCSTYGVITVANPANPATSTASAQRLAIVTTTMPPCGSSSSCMAVPPHHPPGQKAAEQRTCNDESHGCNIPPRFGVLSMSKIRSASMPSPTLPVHIRRAKRAQPSSQLRPNVLPYAPRPPSSPGQGCAPPSQWPLPNRAVSALLCSLGTGIGRSSLCGTGRVTSGEWRL